MGLNYINKRELTKNINKQSVRGFNFNVNNAMECKLKLMFWYKNVLKMIASV